MSGFGRGPGDRYGEHASRLMEATGASLLMVLVLDGDRGSEVSILGTPEAVAGLPPLLEELAADVRRQCPPGDAGG